MDFMRILSFIFGALLIFTGAIPILNVFGVSIDLNMFSGITMAILVSVSGVVLLIDAFREIGLHTGLFFASILVSLLVVFIYIVPVLNSAGILSFTLPEVLKNFLYIFNLILGLFLILGSFFSE